MADFYDQVLAQLRYATAEEKAAIRAELEDHVEDHTETFLDMGCTEEEAGRRALEAMGDPGEIGKALSRQYTAFWLVMRRIVTLLLAFLCVSILLSTPFHRLYLLSGNLTARLAPERSGFASKRELEGTAQALDIRAEVGSDVVYIYKVVLDTDACEAAVYLCNYDKNPFGIASSLLLNDIEIVSPSGEESRSGGGGGNAGAYYWCARGISVEPGDSCLYLKYDSYGERISLEIPLEWGDEA
ncbi:MAG: permease prefix domain 1-containing protein [Clostridiales bacterium]|nr:permease prefix domain 1-containing protein [Clostridiales bacterium]